MKEYKELEELYEKYKDKGLVILGIPCNQFGFQESGTNEEIAEFCILNYGVSFPMFSKIKVNGKNADLLYKFLKKQKSGLFGTKNIKWNFTKFLVNKEGQVIKRFGPSTSPLSFEKEIQKRCERRHGPPGPGFHASPVKGVSAIIRPGERMSPGQERTTEPTTRLGPPPSIRGWDL